MTKGHVAHAPLDPAGPGSIKWLHHRLLKVHGEVEASVERIADSLHGRAARVQDNGLGFDQTRLGSLGDDTEKMVDPVVETLAFFGLAILPMRGEGIDRRISRAGDARGRQRGWRERRFAWPAWNHPLDRAGIDALLDLWKPDRKATWKGTGVLAGWRTMAYQKRGDGDRTQGFGAERV